MNTYQGGKEEKMQCKEAVNVNKNKNTQYKRKQSSII